jgi:hypothetical protein
LIDGDIALGGGEFTVVSVLFVVVDSVTIGWFANAMDVEITKAVII